MSNPQVVIVSDDNMAVIECPACNVRKRISVIQFKDVNHAIKVKCSCGEQFKVTFNFRLDERKEVCLKGTYRKLSEHKAYEKKCQIINLSPGGITAKFFEDFDSKKHDELIVSFSLEDKKKTIVERKVRVRHVKGNIFGAQFFDHELDGQDKKIGYIWLGE
ncbi:MAG: PilZ domain-containing protein [Desulfobulbaceae bacterium]|uniref:PilZ domain-containing protein n=1 Tax=Candidatus Desulfobia pelagia TaxID=2841692 RepID=A0A8J6TEM5_9BACT|nr:PilZ domain-containing protein [Candidatus Desulfobia pelagia]